MGRSFRQQLIRLVTFLGGVYFFLEYFLPKSFSFDRYHEQISNGFVTIGAMAVGLGLINLGAVHGTRIIFQRKNWFFSAVLLVGFATMVLVTVADWWAVARVTDRAQKFSTLRDFAVRIAEDSEAGRTDVPALSTRKEALFHASQQLIAEARDNLTGAATAEEAEFLVTLKTLDGTLLAAREAELSVSQFPELVRALSTSATSYRAVGLADYTNSSTKFAYTVLYDGLFIALGSAMFALLGFYIAGAAYRAFRVRSAESLLMMLAAVIVMLGQIPFGLWIWEGLPELRLWLLTVPSTAAFRAIKFGAAVAGLILALRMWWSIEPKIKSSPDAGGT